MRTLLPLVAALCLLAAYGVAEGVWTDRWYPSPERQQASARLARVPPPVGEWQGETLELDPKQAEKAEIDSSLMRRYKHARTGESVTVLIVCGRPGPVSVHPPDVCYRGLGFEPKSDPARETVAAGPEGQQAEFWAATFEKAGPALPERLAIRWAWARSGDWSAPDHPRFRFAGAKALYKMYVLYQVPEGRRDRAEDPSPAFLKVFLPRLRRTLSADPAS